MGTDPLSRIKLGKSGGVVDDHLPDANIFMVEAIPDYLEYIALFLTTGSAPEHSSTNQKRHLVVRVVDYQLITIKLSKLGTNVILR